MTASRIDTARIADLAVDKVENEVREDKYWQCPFLTFPIEGGWISPLSHYSFYQAWMKQMQSCTAKSITTLRREELPDLRTNRSKNVP